MLIELIPYLKEEFRAKQANIFAALDKLYVLHNAILVESRFIKAFFFYYCIMFLIFMLISAKQTFLIKGYLYLGNIIIFLPTLLVFATQCIYITRTCSIF